MVMDSVCLFFFFDGAKVQRFFGQVCCLAIVSTDWTIGNADRVGEDVLNCRKKRCRYTICLVCPLYMGWLENIAPAELIIIVCQQKNEKNNKQWNYVNYAIL